MKLTSLRMKSCKALGTYLRNLYSAVTNLYNKALIGHTYNETKYNKE